MLQEFGLLVGYGGLLLLLLEPQFCLHRSDRFWSTGCSSLDPGSSEEEATKDEGHRHQCDSCDPRDLNSRAFWPHVRLRATNIKYETTVHQCHRFEENFCMMSIIRNGNDKRS